MRLRVPLWDRGLIRGPSHSGLRLRPRMVLASGIPALDKRASPGSPAMGPGRTTSGGCMGGPNRAKPRTIAARAAGLGLGRRRGASTDGSARNARTRSFRFGERRPTFTSAAPEPAEIAQAPRSSPAQWEIDAGTALRAKPRGAAARDRNLGPRLAPLGEADLPRLRALGRALRDSHHIRGRAGFRLWSPSQSKRQTPESATVHIYH